MKIKNNLRLRFIVSFCLLALMMTLLFAIMVVVIERIYGDEFFRRRLTSEMDYFAERYQLNPQTPLPVSEDIRSYLGTDKMPDYIRRTVNGVSDGIYEKDIDRFEFSDLEKRRESRRQQRERPHGLFYGVRTLHDHQKFYIFIDFKFWHQKTLHLRRHIFWSFLFVTVLAIVLGLITANRVINPLKRLMEVVNKSGPDNLPSGFSTLFKNDEIGALARALEASLERVKKFIKREHRFTRDASHELRTPVTVIKGAVELLGMTPPHAEETVNKLVKRIERSTMDMESTIESLLWLAREPDSERPAPAAALLPLVQNAIQQNRHLIIGKPIEIDLQVVENPVVSAPAGVLTIAISNLIRNACHFTVKGRILVTLKQNEVEVSDTGIGIKEDALKNITKSSVSGPQSDGFGFGLDIVSRLCTRFDWQLKIESTSGQGTKIRLIFQKN